MRSWGQIWEIRHRIGSDRELSMEFSFLIWEFVHSNTDTLRTKKSRTGLESCSSPGQTRWESQHSLLLLSTSFQAWFQQNSNWNCETLAWHPGGCEGWQSACAHKQRWGWDQLGSWAPVGVHLLKNLPTTWTKAQERETSGRCTKSSWSELKADRCRCTPRDNPPSKGRHILGYLLDSDKSLCTANTSVEFGTNIFTAKLLQILYYVSLAELKFFKVSACVMSKLHNLWNHINLLHICQVPRCKSGSSRQVLSLCWVVWRK